MNNLHSSLKEINMRTIVLSVILFCCGMSHVTAQSDYIVTTPSAQEIPTSEEEQFIIKHFPLKPLCKWTPGMKFMFAPSAREMFLPTLLIYNTEKGVDNSLMRHKILTFTGTEEKVQKIADEKIKIPMLGKTESLNASVATGVILYEYVRQKTTIDDKKTV